MHPLTDSLTHFASFFDTPFLETLTLTVPSLAAVPQPSSISNQPSPKFPYHSLPKPLRAITAAIASATATPLAFAATACLGVLSASLGPSTILRDGARRIRPNLFFLLQSNTEPGAETAFELARRPLITHQRILDCNWNACTLPESHVRRHHLITERSEHRRNPSDATLDTDLIRIEAGLLREREAHLRRGLICFDGPLDQCFLRRLPHQPKEALAHISAHPSDLAPLLSGPSRDLGAPARLAEAVLAAGYHGRPLSRLLPGDRQIFLAEPCFSVLGTFTSAGELYTPAALHLSRLLPAFLPLDPSLLPSSDRPLPDNLPEVTPETSDRWRDLVKDFLFYRRGENQRSLRPSRAARKILRAYENECRSAARTTCADIPQFPLHWADQAWRLALLLHTVNAVPLFRLPDPSLRPTDPAKNSATADPTPADPSDPTSSETRPPDPSPRSGLPTIPDHLLPELPADIARAAVTLMRWYTAHQLTLLDPARRQLAADPKSALAILLDRLQRAGGELTITQLHRSHGIPSGQARELAARHPDLLQVTVAPPTLNRAPRTLTISLRPTAPATDAAPPVEAAPPARAGEEKDHPPAPCSSATNPPNHRHLRGRVSQPVTGERSKAAINPPTTAATSPSEQSLQNDSNNSNNYPPPLTVHSLASLPPILITPISPISPIGPSSPPSPVLASNNSNNYPPPPPSLRSLAKIGMSD